MRPEEETSSREHLSHHNASERFTVHALLIIRYQNIICCPYYYITDLTYMQWTLKQIKSLFISSLSLTPHEQYNFRTTSEKLTSYTKRHWRRMHDFCVRKSIISRRVRSIFQKGFSPWIRVPGGIIWWKKLKVENLVTLSLLFVLQYVIVQVSSVIERS
jgi:hypothetical protein